VCYNIINVLPLKELTSVTACVSGIESLVEEPSNTATVALRVIGVDEKGRFESETVKYGLEYQRTTTGKLLHWREPAVIVNDKPVISSERAPRVNKRNCKTALEIWS
jgi:hypothetical protein